MVSEFVQRLGQQLLVGGAPYRIVGGNTYYLAYVKESTLDAALDLTQSFGMNAIRIWAFLDAAQPPSPDQVCFQYLDSKKNQVVVNDGPNGLERLDRAIAKAGARDLRLILTLTNHWKDFGGMPQYVEWFGLAPDHKNLFYTDARCKQAYKHWVEQIVNRRNTITGRLYRDEPAILAWELANEPRCEIAGGDEILLAWVDEMSNFVKQLDANHLVAVGDEGYFKHSYAGHNPLFNGGYGVSCEALLGVGAIDLGTAHLYPEAMAKNHDPVTFGTMWIGEHLDAAERANKPMLIEEYGALSPDRNQIFDVWLKLIEQRGSLGDMLWMSGLPKSQDQPYDPDGYVVENVGEASAIREHATRMLSK